MAVAGRARVQLLPFRQFGGAFPAGIWIGGVFAAGDASGGNVVLTLELNLLTEPFSALIFTLEQVELQPSDASSISYLLEATGFTQTPSANRFPRMGVAVSSVTSQPAAQFVSNMLTKPFYLGQLDRDAGIDSVITIRTVNVDTESYIVHFLGYYWTPDAMNAPGGPQRPPGALFGT